MDKKKYKVWWFWIWRIQFHQYKSPISINDIDINKIVVSNNEREIYSAEKNSMILMILMKKILKKFILMILTIKILMKKILMKKSKCIKLNRWNYFLRNKKNIRNYKKLAALQVPLLKYQRFFIWNLETRKFHFPKYKKPSSWKS